MTDELPYFSHAIQAGWISEHTDIDPNCVDAVLRLEWKFMVATGIAVKLPGAPDWEFRYYQREELHGFGPVVDVDRMPRDSERLAGLPYEVAMRVLDGELEFPQLRALA
jgi:hypothetical protein